MVNFWFKALKFEDMALVRSWLYRPHIREWWGEPEREAALIEEMMEGDEAFPFLVFGGDEAIGYIQYWKVGDARGQSEPEEEIWLGALPDHAIGVDISLADADDLGRGLGRLILRQFARELQAAGHDYVIIDPDIQNLRAIRCYQAAGFVRIGQYPERAGGTLLMRFSEERV